MRTTVLSALILGGLVASAAPALAASPFTDAFLANVRPNLDFLDRSSRVAAERAVPPPLRAYAEETASDAVRTAELLKGVAPDATPAAVASADVSVLATGRSVSVDGPTGGPGQSANGRRPLGTADLAALSKLSGRKFVDTFWLDQVDALSQLRADYQAYVDDGDDAALIAMARAELAKVERRLASLSRI